MPRLLPLLLLTACAYKVELTSAPAGARVDLPDGTQVFTPEVVTLKVAPFNRQEITVSAPGYRPLTVDVRHREARAWRYLTDAVFRPKTFTGAPRGHLELQLVPQHGPAGTWTPESEGL
ncbi:MAG: hypothetical protein EP330_30330 [Deltaproteobacteria bacterium]|nr:MAG: hypothetical protein EP330_30330 [Deltaproteobacteria bacterium]